MIPRLIHPVRYTRQRGRWPFVLTAPIVVDLGMGHLGHVTFEERGQILGMLNHDILTIFEGYQSDGASPCIVICGLRIGTPSPRSAAAGWFVHDFMYQFQSVAPWSFKQADDCLYWLLEDDDFFLSGVYHEAVSRFGGMFRRYFGKTGQVKSHPMP
jgi:hypothetical protein